MAKILRGDIVWADPDPARSNEQSGLRPVLVISQTVFNERSGTVIALAVTSGEPRAGFPLTLKLIKTRMPKPSWVKISQVRVLSVERLGARIARIHSDELEQVIEGLSEIVGD